ncbi:MAG: ABC transporter substrate-binding protein [Massiliimalia sp.]|jgi:lactose/L-arabinose transport system substrate-binding protein
MNGKRIVIALLAALLGCSVMSCGKSDSGSTSGESSSAGQGEIHIASWNNAADNLKAIAEKFNEQNGENGQVVIDYWDSGYTKLKPALQAGNGVPDVFQIAARDAQAFYNSYGLEPFVDLSDLIEPEKENWPEFVLDMCTAEDGKPYAMPWDIGPCALFYRTDIFAEAGIDPNSLTTWDKYIEAGKLLKTKGDYYIADLPFNGTAMDLLMLLLNQAGGEYLDENQDANFNTPEMHQALEVILKLQEENLLCDTPNSWDDRITAINDNRLVAFPNAAWYMGTMKNSCADSAGKWGIVPLPAYEEGGNTLANLGGSVLLISSDTQNEAQAKEFLKYSMMTNEGNDINMDFGEFPSYIPSYSSEKFQEPWDYYGGQVCGELFAGLTNAPSTDFGPYFTDVMESMNLTLGNILSGMDVDEALDAGTADCQNKLDAH